MASSPSASNRLGVPELKDPGEHGISFNPGCPSSLEDLVMTFHRAHSNSLRLAQAINSEQRPSNSFVFNIRLAEYFQHVHVSNSDPDALALARDRLAQWHASNWWKGKFSFSCTSAQQMEDCVIKASTDLVALFMNMHLMKDVNAVVRSAAESLAPNGTLVVVAHSPAFRVVDNEDVNDAVKKLYTLWGEKAFVTRSEVLEKINSPLDYVSLPEGSFIQDVTKRMKINLWDRGNDAFAIPGWASKVAQSRVHPEHRLYSFNDGGKEGSGWRREVDAGWFRRMVVDMVKPHGLDVYESLIQEIERQVQACPGHKVTIEWAAAVLLATRK